MYKVFLSWTNLTDPRDSHYVEYHRSRNRRSNISQVCCIMHIKAYPSKLLKGSHYSTHAESTSCVASILTSKVCLPPPRLYHLLSSMGPVLTLRARYHLSMTDRKSERESSLTYCLHQQPRRQSLVVSWSKMLRTCIPPFLEQYSRGVLLRVVCYSSYWCCKDGGCSLRSMYLYYWLLPC